MTTTSPPQPGERLLPARPGWPDATGHFGIFGGRFVPEALIAGRERAYLAWFFTHYAARGPAVTGEELDVYVRALEAPGALAAALEEGQAMAGALRYASVAGALACTREGAQTSAPHRDEILSRLPDLAPARPL